MTKKKSSKDEDVNTGVDRNVTASGQGAIAVGGDVSESSLNTGDNNTISLRVEQAFSPIYEKIDADPKLSPEQKSDLKADTKDVETELKKGEQADESFLARRLRSIKNMAPDILEVILTTMGNPVAGLGLVAKKVAAKMQASAA